MISVILGYATKYLAPLLAILGAVFAVFGLGKRDAKKDQKIADLEDTAKVKEKVDEVTPSDNRDDAIVSLRSRGLIRPDSER